MEKVLAAQKDCDIFDEIFSKEENISYKIVGKASLATSIS